MKKLILILPLVALLNYSCNKEEETEEKPEFNKSGMLSYYSSSVIIPRYEKLENHLGQLQTAISNFVANSNAINFSEVNKSFDSIYLSWQGVSYFQFGPAESQALKSIFNIFPVDTTKINVNIASGSYVLGSASNTDAIGLPALDYLLHKGTTQANSLNYFTGTNSANRLQYLQDVANQLSTTLTNVVNQWKTSYQGVFNTADGTSQGSSLSEMINALNLDFEKFIRDGKVGIPLGIRSLGTVLPEKSEGYFGKTSTDLCRESIVQLKAYFNGNSGLGLDDYLNHLDATHGSQSLAAKINSQFNSIINKIDALNGPIAEQVTTNQPAVQSLYDEMQKMVVLLKVDLSSALSVLITYQDNDGD